MKKLKRRFTLRTALLTAAVVALLASAAVFMAVSAADDVSPSDVSKSDATAAYSAKAVSSTDVSQSDVIDNRIIADSGVEPALTNEPPENLGEPVVTMTTAKAVGETINLNIEGQNVYVDYGDGNPVAYPGDRIVCGSNIKLYGTITSLSCYDTQLTTLDVSKNTALTSLSCNNNQLTSLDVSHNTALKELHCASNQLTSLDVSGCTALTGLVCGKNPLTSLDVSGCTTLTHLDCDGEQYYDDRGHLNTLNASGCTSLTELNCARNQLTSLDVSGCANLTNLACYYNQLTSLDVSDCTALRTFHCGDNQLTSLDLSHNPALDNFSCDNFYDDNIHKNQLTSLDVSKNPALDCLSCDGNPLTALDVSHNPALSNLSCYNCQLTSLDVSHNPALNELYCGKNRLTALDVSNNTRLIWLGCDKNRLTSLDVSGCTILTELYCYENRLTTLDVSHNTDLAVLDCNNNCIPFSEINKIDSQAILSSSGYFLDFYFFSCVPQTFVIPKSVKAGEELDLSSEYSFDGNVTNFQWYDDDGNVVTPATANNGIFTFSADAAGKTLVCKMSNPQFPDFIENGEMAVIGGIYPPEYKKADCRLTTTEVTIEAAETEETADNSIPVNDNSLVKYAEHSDDATVAVNGEEISFDGVHLMVSELASESKDAVRNAVQQYAAALNVMDDNAVIYDISLVDGNGSTVTVTKGKIKVHLKYPDTLSKPWTSYTFHLYHQKDDGSIEEIPIVCQSDGIWFETDSFSPYALVWNEKTSGGSNVDTGESAVLIWVMAGFFALSLAGAGVVLYRRRKLTAE